MYCQQHIKIGIFFFDGFFRSNQFCDADSGENYNSRGSKQEALLNSPLKLVQLFTKVNAFRVKLVSHLCVNSITPMTRVRRETSSHDFASYSVTLFSKSKTREQCFPPCFKPIQRYSHKNYCAELQLHQYD